VPEQHLDHTDIHLLLQQMSRVAVAQRVWGDALVDPSGFGSQVTDAVELPGAHRVDRVLSREQPAPVEHLSFGMGVPPPDTQALEQQR
jgi:hypothetical protein